LNIRWRIARRRREQPLHHLARQRPVAQIHGAERGCIELSDLLELAQAGKTAGTRQPGPLAAHLDTGVGDHTGAGRHHHMLQRRHGVGRALAGRNARIHVRDTLRGQRVAAQIGPAAVVIEPAGLLQLAEHAHKALGAKPAGDIRL
jgi:hypothetical protein